MYPALPPSRKKAESEVEPEAEPKADFELRDPVLKWRFDALLAADFTETQSLALALDRGVDLRKAVALRAKTELAYEILR